MSVPSNVVKLECYRSPYGLYFKDLGSHWWPHNKINGKVAVASHSPNWKLLEGEQEVISVIKTVKKYPQVLGYRLLDQGLASDKIPNYLTLEDVDRVFDDIDE